MNQIKGSGCEHMKFLTFGTSLYKMKHPSFLVLGLFSTTKSSFIRNIKINTHLVSGKMRRRFGSAVAWRRSQLDPSIHNLSMRSKKYNNNAATTFHNSHSVHSNSKVPFLKLLLLFVTRLFKIFCFIQLQGSHLFLK